MKKSKKIIITLIVVSLILINMVYFGYGILENPSNLGLVTKNLDTYQKIKNLDFQTKIFLAQWLVVILIVTIFLTRYLKKRIKDKKEKKQRKTRVHKKGGKTHTDLDELYKMLKGNKKLKISEIAEEFKISKEKALEWGKILENEDIIDIDYPAFTSPEIKLKNSKTENGKKEKKQKENNRKKKQKNK